MPSLRPDEKLILESTTSYVTDLYVMQNEYGLIKIGHSVDPEKRRQTLQIEERCKIVIVLTLPERGDREMAIHRKVRNYNIIGEWFEGTEASRKAIQAAVRRGLNLDWPFDLDEIASNAWLDEFSERYAEKKETRRIRMLIRRIKSSGESGWLADAYIWEILMIKKGEFLGMMFGQENGQTVLRGLTQDPTIDLPVPAYSSDLETALSLWPEDIRPSSWDGTILECCLAALQSTVPGPKS